MQVADSISENSFFLILVVYYYYGLTRFGCPRLLDHACII